MEILKTEIEGVYLLKPRVFEDARGYFFESFSERDFQALTGTSTHFVQDNESKSCYGVVRGLHFQKEPHAQAKLVRCIEGAVLDVAVDIRAGSPTYGKYVSAVISAENHMEFFLPKGMAHGFAVLSPTAIFQYKCDDFYHPETEGAIAWNDPDLGIDWMIPAESVILSEKDKHHPAFADLPEMFKTL